MDKWDIEAFTGKSWISKEKFLTDYKDDFEDLAIFAASLDEFSEKLKSKMTGIIHQDYTEFVAISKQLLQLGETIQELVKLLRSCEKSVTDASKTRENATKELREQFAVLQKTKHDYYMYTLALESYEHLQDIENRLKEVESDIYSLIDIATGFAVTRVKLSKLDQPSEKRHIETEFLRLYDDFTKSMRSSLVHAINNKDAEEIEVILHAATISGSQDDIIYKAFSDTYFPELMKSCEKAWQRHGTETNYSIVFTDLMNYLTGDNEFTFVQQMDGYDFMEACFWPYIIPFAREKLSMPFQNAMEQKRCYEMWLSFIEVCECCCKTVDAVKAIRASKEYEQLQNDLRLPVYAQHIKHHFTQCVDLILQEESERSLLDKFVSLYADLYSDEFMIKGRVEADFAVIGMTLISRLLNHINDLDPEHQVNFIPELPRVSDLLTNATPDILQEAMQIAIDSLNQTALSLRGTMINHITEKCKENLAYMDKFTWAGINSRPAAAVMNPYISWAEGDGAAIANPAIFTDVTRAVLSEFYAKTNLLIQHNTEQVAVVYLRHAEKATATIEKFRKDIRANLDVIANTVRGKKVEVDSLQEYKQIVEMLQ